MQRPSGYPPPSLAFDWIMALLAVILMGGVIQDGWAHSHGLVDQSFLTPWHAILYGTMVLNGIVLGIVALRNRLRGYTFPYVLPFGYWTSLAGVLIFAAGGVFDLWWHTRYGIETDITALISPSHLWLALGGALVFVGPLRSIAARYGPQSGGWKIAGPAIFSSLAVLTLLGFFTQYAQPIGDSEESAVLGYHEPQTGGALYSVRGNGSRETRLLTIANSDIWGATVSPDGRQVAFRVSEGTHPASDIYVSNIDGSHPRRITHSGRHDTQPAWSPDGKSIAFVSIPAGTSGDYMLQTVHPDGTGLRTVLSQTTVLQFPAWSPGGTRIAYQTREGLRQQIATVDTANGSAASLGLDVRNTLTSNEQQPAWSINDRLAFTTAEDSIAIAPIRTRATAIAEFVRNGQMPAWSKDGKMLAFIREAGGDAQVFVSDGKHERNISQLAGLNASRPAWTPRGDIIFTATGRPVAATTFLGLAYSEDSNLIEAIVVTGIALLLIRRWRMPFGAMTFLFGMFAVAMAFQSDLYYEIIAAALTGLLTDTAIALFGERVRSGFGFYAIGFCIPAVLFTLYLIVAQLTLHRGLDWPPNMIFGSPFIAGFAGLLIAFCYAPPLRQPHIDSQA